MSARLEAEERRLARALPPERVLALLPSVLDPETVERLVASDRLAGRLSEHLRRQAGVPPLDPALLEAEDRALMLLDAEGLEQLQRMAGAIWHGQALKRIILAEPRRRMAELIGEDALAGAGRNVEVSPAIASPAEPEALAAAIDADGAACLEAWCRAQPAAIAERIRLKRDAEAPDPTDDHLANGPAVIARAVKEHVHA